MQTARLLLLKNRRSIFFRKAAIVLSLALLLLGAAIFVILSRPTTPVSPNNLAGSNQLFESLHCVEELPLDVLVGQVLMVGLTADAMGAQAPIFKQYHVGGAVLMSSPSSPLDGSIERFKNEAGSSGDPLLIAADEEGGPVQRFQSLGLLPAPEQVATTLTPEQAQQLIAEHGLKLKKAGIDMILGPLADVAPENRPSPLGNRVFSNDPKIVNEYARAYVQGWQAAELLATLKHFPGMGSASGNTDYQPATTPPLSLLLRRDFTPYRNLATSNTAVMIGNQSTPGWFAGPASLSPKVNQYLRGALGYEDNLVITDSLAAVAIISSSTVPNAVVSAIAAGNDMTIIVEPDLYRITPARNKSNISDAEVALEKAVTDGIIPKKQLVGSVIRKLSAQHIAPCSLKTNQ